MDINQKKRQLFPEKLWELVHKPSSGIRWSPDGKEIEIERVKLERFLQTKFRSNNFDSFIRQLHFYGFKKCGNSYRHEKFQRAHPTAHLSMKRKYSNLSKSPPSEDNKIVPGTQVTMYTIDPLSPIREDRVEAVGDGNSIKIELPKNIGGPKSLILHGNENVLSAYFVYSTESL